MTRTPGDAVLDCCAGSGTTAIAALNQGRRYLCIERDTEHFQVMQRRIDEHQRQPQTTDLFAVVTE